MVNDVRIVGRFVARLRGEFVQAVAWHAVEAWKWVDDVGGRLQRNAQLDREHDLARDLARARSDQHRADQHPVLAVADEFECALVEVVDGAPCGLGRVSGGDNDVEAFRARGSLRQSHRRDFRIGECHARDGRVIGSSVHAPHELFAFNVDSTQVRELSFTSKEPRFRCFHRGGGPAVIEIARHRSHAFGNLGEVNSPFDA